MQERLLASWRIYFEQYTPLNSIPSFQYNMSVFSLLIFGVVMYENDNNFLFS